MWDTSIRADTSAEHLDIDRIRSSGFLPRGSILRLPKCKFSRVSYRGDGE